MSGSGGKDEFVFCGACGTRLDAGVRFCTSCGASQAQFAEGESTEPAADATPAGEEAGGDALANAPTEAMPAGSPPQGGEGGQSGGSPFTDWLFGRPGDHRGQAGGGAAASTPTEAMAAGQRGFFESLFDIRFEHLITPKLIRFFYALSILVLGVGTIVVIVASFAASETTGVIVLFLAPLSALIYLVTIRLWLELIVVAFKIRESVERVAENTRRSA